MPTASQKAMTVAANPEFQSRVKLALVRTALLAIDDDNSARSVYARKVLRSEMNLPAVAIAVVANASIAASIESADEGDETFGVADADIAFVVAPGDDPAAGVFGKLARANAGF